MRSRQKGSTALSPVVLEPGDQIKSPLRLILGAAPVGAALTLSMTLRLLATILAARLASVSDFGSFATLNAIAAFVSAIAMGGWPSYLLAIVPKTGLTHEMMKTLIVRLGFSCLAFSIVQSLFVVASLHSRADWQAVLLAAMLMTGTVLGSVFNEAQRAAGNILRSRFSIAIVPPAVASGLLLLLYFSGIRVTAEWLLTANGVGWLALWAFAAVNLRRHYTPETGAQVLKVSRRDLMLTKVSQAGLATADIVAVGWLLGPTEGAFYAIASRIALTSGMGYTAVVMAYGPNVSKLANQPAQMRTLVRRMTLIGGAVTIPITITAAIYGRPLLQLFGSTYSAAYPILVILLLGVAANALSGPIGLVVNVTGQEAIGRRTLLLACAAFFALVAPATLLFGTFGTAILWSGTTLLWNVALWLQVDLDHGSRSPSGSSSDA